MPQHLFTRWVRLVLACGTIWTLATACADPIAPGAEVTPSEDVLWRLRISPRGITMAVGQSLTLRPTVLNILGEPMTLPESASVQYETLDSSRVTVTPEGLLTGRKATVAIPGLGQLSPVTVIASLTAGQVVKVDTIYVAVTNTAPADPPATVSLLPVNPYPQDSTWVAYTAKMIPITVLTANGDTVPNPYLYLHTNQWRLGLKELLNPVNRFMIFVRIPGRFWVYATGWVYGVELQDSAEYIMTDLPFNTLSIAPNPANPNEVLPLKFIDDIMFAPPCGTIQITNGFQVPVDVTFDDPSGTSVCQPGDETGNVSALQPNQTTIRKFRNSGIYTWTVTRTGGPAFSKPFMGKIRVRAHTEF